MSTVAEELQKAWNEASQESGFHDKGNLTIVKAEKARDKFYQLFSDKTGLHDSLVRGLFNDWVKIPNEEAVRLRVKHNVTHTFCAFLAEYIERRTAVAGLSTAYTFDDDDQETVGEVH